MRICVIGGTGFVGRAVVQHLASRGHDLLIVHRGQTEPADLPEAEHLHTDRNDLPEHRHRIARSAPDGLVDTYAMTAEHADRALDAVSEAVRLVVLSSMDVYRAYASLLAGLTTDPVPLTEASPVRDQRYPYRGQSLPGADFDVDRNEKLDVEERYLQRQATVLRLGFVFGEHDPQRREDFILRRVRANRTRIPLGSGNWIVSRTYVGDVGDAVERAVVTPSSAGEVLNICEAESPTAALWAQAILDAAGSGAELVRVPDELLPPDLALTSAGQPLLATPAKARELLGWRSRDSDAALRRSVRWHLEHPPEPDLFDEAADDRALAAGYRRRSSDWRRAACCRDTERGRRRSPATP